MQLKELYCLHLFDDNFWTGMPTDKRKVQLDAIKKLFIKSREYGDDKVQLAMQTYEMVRY